MEGFRRTWRAIALAVVFALVGASFALAMPAAINFVTQNVTSESTVFPRPPGTDPSPLFTPGAPGVPSDDDDEEGASEDKDKRSVSRPPVVTPRVEGPPPGRGTPEDKPARPKKPKKAKKPKPDRPDKPEPPEPPQKPEDPKEPEPHDPGSSDDDDEPKDTGSAGSPDPSNGGGQQGQGGGNNGGGNNGGGKGGKGKGNSPHPSHAGEGA